jgi:hypothetical protein
VGAGIGVGATVAVALIALLAWLFFRERKKRIALQGKGQSQESVMGTTMYPPQTVWKSANTEYYAHEASSDLRHELEQGRARHEMDHGRARQELA